MRRFSTGTLGTVALLHFVGTAIWISASAARIKAFDAGQVFPWLTILGWIWMPIPLLLQHYLRFDPSKFFYFLALPWSFCVGVCFGLLMPRLSQWFGGSGWRLGSRSGFKP